MCGRFTNELTWSQIHALYSIHERPATNLPPRFNIAPTQDVDFVHLDKAGNMELDRGRWWLVPFFAKELPKAAMFNARIETIDTSGAFREGFKSRRCLIPADGYFEWTKGEDGGKDPWLLQRPGGAPFSFAGIWAHNDNLGVTSCAIITAPAVPEIAKIHDRMPIILTPEAYRTWLNTEIQGTDAKALLLDAQIDSELEFYRVGREVNSSRYEGSDTKKPLINSL
ncbi:SOS response-associated peptidase [Devosia sp. XJ19-1]|uniref:Abasic site processing protein n=1 Tax=Devosia ureilytica TaxID=2952754 RepID=A0A9Q4AMP0_9HYPH|nr:SOS response-associated peptidase [Devosia ureilytica]MCP8883028.1 SOS response-associated peptidase [Devosia ureilytica]MCP8886604.1 SOS response-associated peptidase [Devosia ureilytica]